MWGGDLCVTLKDNRKKEWTVLMKIMNLLEKKCKAKSFRVNRYSLDLVENHSIDYEPQRSVMKKIAEKEPMGFVNLTEDANKVANYKSIFTYFLDGSRRVYKVDDMVFSSNGVKSIYPVVAGQVAVACCKRNDKLLHKEKFDYECDIALPDVADADGSKGFFEGIATDINAKLLSKKAIPFKHVFSYSTSHTDASKYEDKGIAKIQDRMIELEKEVVADLVKDRKLGMDNYLIKDGSLEYRVSSKDRNSEKGVSYFKKNYRYVLGVSKRFNPELYLGKNNKANPGELANLPLYHRTSVMLCEHNGIHFGVWYIRIREINKTLSPFDGIIKVEKMLVTDDEIKHLMLCSIEVNTLSAYLINERNPVCYGLDSRWANHIYPIYLTELYIKQRYIGTEAFLQLF